MRVLRGQFIPHLNLKGEVNDSYHTVIGSAQTETRFLTIEVQYFAITISGTDMISTLAREVVLSDWTHIMMNCSKNRLIAKDSLFFSVFYLFYATLWKRND